MPRRRAKPTSARAAFLAFALGALAAFLLWPFLHVSNAHHASVRRAPAAPVVDAKRVFADLKRRVDAVVARAKATAPPQDRLPGWATEARERVGTGSTQTKDGLPPWTLACDLECRLSSCSRPGMRALPQDIPRTSRARAYLDPVNASAGAWPEHVEAAGVLGWRRRHLAGAARVGSPVPCVAAPYPDSIAGLREHLPDPGAPRAPFDAEAEAFQRELRALQNGPCSTAIGAGKVGTMGIGGVLKSLAPALGWAAQRRRPFAISDTMMNHMFRASKNSLWDVVDNYSACPRATETYDIAPASRPVGRPLNPNLHADKYAPPKYAHRGHFWWTAQLTRFLFRPKAATRAAAQRELAKMGGRPFVGLHVRHGDKCRGDRVDATVGGARTTFRVQDDRKSRGGDRTECASLAEYMVHVQRMYELYGVTDVYLATDDADVVDRALRDPCYAHFTFHYQEYDRLVASDYAYFEEVAGAPKLRGFSLEICQNAESGATDARGRKMKCPVAGRDRLEETLTMMVDLAVLGEADAFVGSLWSNVGRIAYELSAAEKGCLPPVASRDVGWCNMHGQVQDGSPWGHLNC